MKDTKDMSLKECLEEVELLNGVYDYDDPVKLAKRIDELTRWIPVSERMPTEEDRDVLAWYATKYPFANLVNWYEFPLNNKDVTHWKRITPPEGV